VEKGLGELETGIGCMDNFSARGRPRTEAKDPALEAAIRALVDSQSQPDPKFQSAFLYTRVTGEKVRHLNRLNYRLRCFQKTKPLKKIQEMEAIFEQVAKANRDSDEREESLNSWRGSMKKELACLRRPWKSTNNASSVLILLPNGTLSSGLRLHKRSGIYL
jgi:hypothetical protein